MTMQSYLLHSEALSLDIDHIMGKKFDYTLVLDGDTLVPQGSLRKIMEVAATFPDKCIIQPAIKLAIFENQSLFAQLQAIREEIYASIGILQIRVHGRSSFYGKGLIQNRLYISTIIGTRKSPIERIPIEILSHDAYEAAILSPVFVESVILVENTCDNYLSWDIREKRWNRGELVMAHYFYPLLVGTSLKWVMKLFSANPVPELKLRTKTRFNESALYIALRPLMLMISKPLLLFYWFLTVHLSAYLKYSYFPAYAIILGLSVLPKLAFVNSKNENGFKKISIVVETVSSFLQYTPEPVMGSIRGAKALYAHLSWNSGWIPQFEVERDFGKKTAAYFKQVILCSLASSFCLILFKPQSIVITFVLGTTVILPFYAAFTASLPCRL